MTTNLFLEVDGLRAGVERALDPNAQEFPEICISPSL